MKKIERKNFIDIILFAFAVYLLFTTNWSNIDKFSQLLLLMYALCVTLCKGNSMNIKQKEIIEREKQKENMISEQQSEEQTK